MTLVDALVHHDYFPLFTFIIGVLVTVFFYYKSIRSKQLKYVIKSNNLIKDHSSVLSDLSIRYKDEKVKDLTATRLMFWNSGKVTIDGNDNTSAKPLSLKVDENIKVLEASLLGENNAAAQIKLVKESEDSLRIEFDYLDSMDGAIINLIHTGIDSNGILLRGKVKGVKKIVQSSIPKAPNVIRLFIPIPWEYGISKYSVRIRRVLHGWSYIINALAWMLVIGVAKYLESVFPDKPFFDMGGDSTIAIWLALVPCLFLVANGIYILSKKVPGDIDLYEEI